jgi:hypothetical protein
MPRVFYMPGTRSTRVLWMLEEIGKPHDAVRSLARTCAPPSVCRGIRSAAYPSTPRTSRRSWSLLDLAELEDEPEPVVTVPREGDDPLQFLGWSVIRLGPAPGHSGAG